MIYTSRMPRTALWLPNLEMGTPQVAEGTKKNGEGYINTLLLLLLTVTTLQQVVKKYYGYSATTLGASENTNTQEINVKDLSEHESTPLEVESIVAVEIGAATSTSPCFRHRD